MTNRRGLIILAMVFVALAALLAIQNNQHPVGVTPTPTFITQNTVFNDFTVDSIQAVRLRSPETGKTFIISRTADNSWAAPESTGQLNLKEAAIIAATMVQLPYQRTLPLPAKTDLSTYGFTPEGILSVEILLTNGHTHVVAVGYRTVSAESYYALVDDRSEMYLLQRPAIDYLISRLKNPPVA